MADAGGPQWPAGKGEMARRIAGHDWAATPLGPLQAWPQSLRSAVDIMLESGFPATVQYGPEAILLYNDAYVPVIGERHPAALGRSSLETFSEVRPHLEDVFARVFAGEAVVLQDQHFAMLRNGRQSDVWFTLSHVPLRNEAGKIVAALVLGAETSARMLAERRRDEIERSLRHREAELALVQEIGGIGGVDVKLVGPYRGRRSPEYLRLHGLTEEQADETHEDWLARLHPSDREQADRNFRETLAGTRSTYEGEYRIIRPSDGEVRWITARAAIERDASGRAIRLVGAHIDVTERKRVEGARAEIERRLRALMEGIPQLVWRAGHGGRWTWSSPQWTDYTGQTEEASRGMGWLDALHPEDRERTRKAWRSAERTGKFEVDYRVCRQREDRFRWFQTRATPVRDTLGSIVEWLGTSTDMHELRQLQEEQKVLVAELQHRTRNLIAVVRSTASQTLASAATLEDFAAAFNDRLAALSRVQGLLSRTEQEPITIGTLVRLELDALGAKAEPDRIRLDGPETALQASGVQTLALALHELATNAKKYGALANGDGRLDVSWRVGGAAGGRRRLVLDWVETASLPQDGTASRRGYGRELIERALPYSLGAATSFEVTPQGVRCRIDMPLAGGGAG